MKSKRQNGFTMVELMVAVITGLIVILAASIVGVTGHKSWNQAWERANLQRDASYAMQRINQSVKAGISAKVLPDVKSVRINRENGWERFYFVPCTSSIMYQFEGHEPITIIDGKVEDIEFDVQDSMVGIELELKQDNLQFHLISTVMMRNYGG